KSPRIPPVCRENSLSVRVRTVGETGVLSRESQKAASRVPVAVFLAGRDNAARTVSPLSDAPVRNGVARDRTVAAAARGPRRSRAWRHDGLHKGDEACRLTISSSR